MKGGSTANPGADSTDGIARKRSGTGHRGFVDAGLVSPLHGENFDLHFCPGAGAAPRLGLVVAKKLARHAVWRNAIKRAGREAFRLQRRQLPAHDLVLRLAKPVTGDDGGQRRAWRQDIERLLRRLTRKGALK